jgi:dynactin 1
MRLSLQTISLKAHEELQAKLRILEGHRAQDRERLRELERTKEETDAFMQARPRLQGPLPTMFLSPHSLIKVDVI